MRRPETHRGLINKPTFRAFQRGQSAADKLTPPQARRFDPINQKRLSARRL